MADETERLRRRVFELEATLKVALIVMEREAENEGHADHSDLCIAIKAARIVLGAV
jgi:hypothetical protein